MHVYKIKAQLVPKLYKWMACVQCVIVGSKETASHSTTARSMTPTDCLCGEWEGEVARYRPISMQQHTHPHSKDF